MQNVLEVALELEKLGPALVCKLLGDSINGLVAHDDVDVSVLAARWSCCGQSKVVARCQLYWFKSNSCCSAQWWLRSSKLLRCYPIGGIQMVKKH
eukprot:6186535-Pleurochrysis_carterae.AAC.2